MEFGEIQDNGSRMSLIRQTGANAQATEKPRGEAKTEKTQATGKSDVVTFTDQTSETQLRAMIIERVLMATETELSQPVQDLFQEAGKDEFWAEIAAPTEDSGTAGGGIDTSSEATANRIVQGITGYIFGAWQMQHPDMTEEDLLEFQEIVMGGFEKGLQEAKEIITALSAMSPELADSIDDTESLVRKQLDDFFTSALEQLGGGSE